MATVFTPASKAIEKLVETIIEEHHGSLRDAEILCVAASKMPKDRPAKLCTASPGEQAQGFNLRFQYDEEVLEVASPAAQAAIVDNALADMKGVERRSRDGQDPRMVYQPNRAIRIHPDVIRRRGAVLEDWGRAEQAFKQMTLPLTVRRRANGGEEASEE